MTSPRPTSKARPRDLAITVLPGVTRLAHERPDVASALPLSLILAASVTG